MTVTVTVTMTNDAGENVASETTSFEVDNLATAQTRTVASIFRGFGHQHKG